jgi:hypothetical protein
MHSERMPAGTEFSCPAVVSEASAAEEMANKNTNPRIHLRILMGRSADQDGA